MKLKNTFVQGKMNKDVDERLIPKGSYVHAENIKVANSEGSDAGAIENSLGSEQLTSFNLTNPVTIGAFADGFNQKIYWATTSEEKDMVVEYDILNSSTNVLLESSKPNSVLNFDRSFLITGITKVINEDPNEDLLLITDDLNNPRCINIERAKGYGLDGFIEDDISLIKKPPRFAPRTNLTFTSSTLENNMEEKFFSFSYRYKYLDGEYSALSSYSNYNFSPSAFRLDYQTMENEGMVNSFNAINIKFNTGSKRVIGVQIVVKEPNSNSLSIVETFDKENESWGDDQEKTLLFSDNKKYIFLPEDELFRAFDNVPRKSKSLEIIGNRVVFGNYLEGYDLVNKFNEKVRLDYSLSLLSKDLGGEDLSFTLGTSTSSDDEFTFDLSGRDLKSGTRITLDIFLSEITYNEGSFSENFDFILNRNYTGAQDLAEDEEFILFVETIMTSRFNSDYSATPPDDSELILTAPFTISGSTTNTISIVAPKLTYKIDNTPSNTSDNDFREEISNWSYTEQSGAFYKLVAIDSSIKTNRNYEVGIIYMEEYNRATTVLTGLSNTLFVPQEFSINQNKILVNLNHRPPKWADRYKIVVKQNKLDYQTIYTNLFYEEGLFRWVKLEGANINKVKEDDILIVKSDLGGPISRPVRVRVLELATKQPDFILENENSDGQLIVEEAGLYMKIKPSGFDMNFDNSTARTFEGSSHLRYPKDTFTNPDFGDVVDGSFVPFSLLAGSTVKVFIEFEARGSISYKETYDRTFKVALEHNSIKDWFNEEVEDLGSFGEDFTRDFGFTNDSKSFFVRAHRDGTASRKITTTLRFEILFSEGIVIFETEPKENDNNIFYETEQTFEIVDDFHLGNTQSQSEDNTSAIIEVDFFNCYVQGNGAESYRVRDTFNSNSLNIDLRPSTTSIEGYQEVRRYADLTYSAPYNENANLNGLNEFNLSLANYKEDMDKKYGFIQKLYSRDTDLLVFQEDKVSKVLFGKDLLLNADGSSNLSSIEDVLGQQIMYLGEYGISRNPESFTFDGGNIYFTDSKRGAVLRLGNNGLNKISSFGMSSWFRDKFRDNIDSKKIGGFDPYNNQYVIHPSREKFIQTVDVDCSGSVSRSNFDGTIIINMEYGVKIGTAGFDYSSNGVPVKYDIEWGDETYTTGFVGDNSYNDELSDLGLADVSGSGNGTFTFSKDDATPTSIKITVISPICDASFTIDGTCIDSPELKVVSVIINGVEDLGLSMLSRYRWISGLYSSPLKNYNSIFDIEKLDTYDLQEGEEGSFFIPPNGSTVRIESFNGFNQSANFSSGNRLGYLVSDTLYTEDDLDDLVNLSAFSLATQTTYNNGDVLNTLDFTFNRLNNEEYLYLVWDYFREPDTLTLIPSERIDLPDSPSSGANIAVLSNRSWLVVTTPPSWFTISGASGSGDGQFTVNADDNTTNSSRSFELTVSTQTQNPISETVMINQASQGEELLYAYTVSEEATEVNACNTSPDRSIYSSKSSFISISVGDTLYYNSGGTTTVNFGFYSREGIVVECDSDGIVVLDTLCQN